MAMFSHVCFAIVLSGFANFPVQASGPDNDYFRGIAILSEDPVQAVKLFRKSAERGFDEAQFNMGASYEFGRGVPQDYVTAHMWYNLAAALGHDGGPIARDRVAVVMTPADISEAQRRARACQASHYKNCN